MLDKRLIRRTMTAKLVKPDNIESGIIRRVVSGEAGCDAAMGQSKSCVQNAHKIKREDKR